MDINIHTKQKYQFLQFISIIFFIYINLILLIFGIILLCVWCNPCLFGGELAGRLHQQVLQSAIWRRSKQHVNYRKEHLFTCISHLVCFTPCRVWPRCTVISCFMKTCCRIFLQTNKLYLLYTGQSYIVSDGLSEQYGKCRCTNIL